MAFEDIELRCTYALVCERFGVASARMETLLRVVVGVDLVKSGHNKGLGFGLWTRCDGVIRVVIMDRLKIWQ